MGFAPSAILRNPVEVSVQKVPREDPGAVDIQGAPVRADVGETRSVARLAQHETRYKRFDK